MKKRNGFTMRRREAVTGILFISPWIIGLLVFFLKNIVETVRFSFNELKMLDGGGYTLAGVGWENFRQALFVNVAFNRELVNAVVGMLVNVPLVIFFSLFIAMMLNRKFKMRGLVRAIFFLPVIMTSSSITTALDSLLIMMMNGVSSIPPDMQQQGGINASSIVMLLGNFGMPMQIINYIINAISQLYNIIRASGVQILIFLAALQSIPGSLYEVAQIEGATGYEAFWKITFPMVSPLILTNVVYTIIDTYAKSLVVTLSYNTAFVEFNFGVSAAMSLISSLVACLVLLIIGWGISRYVYYQN
jgi:ABC-type sugar transport system permease subunit